MSLTRQTAATYFHARTKLRPWEVLLDALSSVTAAGGLPFDGLPKGARATQLPDGKMDNPFLKTFGRPARELACECERETDSNLSQALQLIGGATVNGKLRDDKGRMAELAKSTKSPEEITKELYWIAVAREPNASETAAAVKTVTSTSLNKSKPALEDLGWVLINQKDLSSSVEAVRFWLQYCVTSYAIFRKRFDAIRIFPVFQGRAVPIGVLKCDVSPSPAGDTAPDASETERGFPEVSSRSGRHRRFVSLGLPFFQSWPKMPPLSPDARRPDDGT